MDWITPKIAIGNFLDAADIALLAREGIQSIVCLDENHAKNSARKLGVQRFEAFHLQDGEGNDPQKFQRIVASVQDLVEQSPPVLVHCHAGRSRSAIVVAGYLVAAENVTPEAAIARVAAKREINISQGLERLLYWL